MKSDDQGSVVAETAMVLPTLLLITTLLLGGISALDAKMKCNQLASSIARAIERDEPDWQSMAHNAWPEADIKVTTTNNWVSVTVTKELKFNFSVEGKAIAFQRI